MLLLFPCAVRTAARAPGQGSDAGRHPTVQQATQHHGYQHPAPVYFPTAGRPSSQVPQLTAGVTNQDMTNAVQTGAPAGQMLHPVMGVMQQSFSAQQTARPLFQSPQTQGVPLNHPMPQSRSAAQHEHAKVAHDAAIMGNSTSLHSAITSSTPALPATPPFGVDNLFTGLHVRATLSPTNSQPLSDTRPMSTGTALATTTGSVFNPHYQMGAQLSPGLPSSRQGPDQQPPGLPNSNPFGLNAATMLRSGQSGATSPAPSTLPPSASVPLSRVSSIGSRTELGDFASEALSNGRWSSNMSAAAVMARAAQSGVPADDIFSKKVIKKKTRGIKVSCICVNSIS